MAQTSGELQQTTANTPSHDTQPQISPESTKLARSYFDRHFLPIREGIILLGLTLIALIPRVVLATQLDIVTDEGIYIIGGKIYLALLAHLRITADQWNFNYEHPPFAKLLIGSSIYLNALLGHLFGELLAARMPSIVLGTLLVVATYWLGRKPLGHVIALLGALCLAVSPWLVYFSALAYLDMTMTALVTIAYLLLWHAIQQPRLYLLVAVLVGLGAASKYTAVLAIPGMLVFIAYYFFVIRLRLPAEQRPKLPWLWWIEALLLSPITFFIADPAIWPHPLGLLIRSFRFEWLHSRDGHVTFIFLAGHYSSHSPHWAVLYIILTKMSAFVTIPAACFVIFALVQLFRFHLRKAHLPVTEVTNIAFLLIWLLSILGMFSLLNIVVGTHYHLLIAVPVALAGAFGWTILFRYRRGTLFQSTLAAPQDALFLKLFPHLLRRRAKNGKGGDTDTPHLVREAIPSRPYVNRRAAVVLALLTVFLVGPHLVGLTSVYAAEGYTSEFFNGENNVLQVAYPAYREAGLWLSAHTHTPGRVGLVAIIGTIVGTQDQGAFDVSWYTYNHDLEGRLQFLEAPIDPQGRLLFIKPPIDSYSLPYDYIVWPMHLIQRGFSIPQAWNSHIVHEIKGGNSTYCFILARDPTSISGR